MFCAITAQHNSLIINQPVHILYFNRIPIKKNGGLVFWRVESSLRRIPWVEMGHESQRWTWSLRVAKTRMRTSHAPSVRLRYHFSIYSFSIYSRISGRPRRANAHSQAVSASKTCTHVNRRLKMHGVLHSTWFASSCPKANVQKLPTAFSYVNTLNRTTNQLATEGATLGCAHAIKPTSLHRSSP